VAGRLEGEPAEEGNGGEQEDGDEEACDCAEREGGAHEEFIEAGSVFGEDGGEGLKEDECDGEAGYAAEEDEDQILGEELAEEAWVARAEGDTEGEFALTMDAACEEEVADVAAGNEEQKEGCAGEDEEFGLDLLDEFLVVTDDGGGCAVGVGHAPGEAGADFVDEGAEFGLGCFEGSARFKAADGLEVEAAPDFADLPVVERDGEPEFGLWRGEGEGRGHDAEDFEGALVEEEFLAEDVGVGVEAGAPEVVA